MIEVDRNGKVGVECRLLKRNYQKWNVIGPRPTLNPIGGELIPEEAEFGDNVRRISRAAQRSPHLSALPVR